MGTTVVDDVLAKLNDLKAKVEETIEHVKSGVTNLNEDQVDKAVELFTDLEAEAAKTKTEALSLLGRAEAEVKKAGTWVGEELEKLKEKTESVL